MSYELTRAINEMVEKKTFSLDAVDAIKDLRAKAETLERRLEQRDSLVESQGATITAMTAKCNDLQIENAAFNARLAELEKREKAADKAIYEAEKQTAVAQAWQAAMGMVFRPAAVRTEIQRQVAKPVEGNPGGNGGYPSGGFLATGQESETTVVTQE